MEERNVNRILNSTIQNVAEKRAKVDVLADAAERIGLGTNFIAIRKNLWDPDVIREVAQCDVVFGCMDTVDGRYLLNALSSYYSIPYFDIGVRIDAAKDETGKAHVREICGTVNYLRPGRSSLVSRGLFTMSDVAVAGLRRNDPAAYAHQVKDGYIKGVTGHRPAVISLNMFASALAVSELLARLHPFREEDNSAYAAVTFSLGSVEMFMIPRMEYATFSEIKSASVIPRRYSELWNLQKRGADELAAKPSPNAVSPTLQLDCPALCHTVGGGQSPQRAQTKDPLHRAGGRLTRTSRNDMSLRLQLDTTHESPDRRTALLDRNPTHQRNR